VQAREARRVPLPSPQKPPSLAVIWARHPLRNLPEHWAILPFYKLPSAPPPAQQTKRVSLTNIFIIK
jgi:hypothetical protein